MTRDTRKLYGLSDPLTSKQAAEMTERRRRNLDIVCQLVRDNVGRTSAELARIADREGVALDKHEIRRRLTDLMHTRDVRQGRQRKCHVANAQAVEWWPAGAPNAP